MKKYYLIVLLVIGINAFSQQKGITYQAVIINPNEIAAPGFNGNALPLANTSICLAFQVLNTSDQIEYQESQLITTDAFGMVNLVIGTGTSAAGLVSSIEAVLWSQGNKKLVVSVNIEGNCNNYTEISRQVLNYTPFSFYAQNADLKDGYITDVKVAMGINPAKVGLGNVNNTSDVAKPVSTATQNALNLKANITDVATFLSLKENSSNKSNDIVVDAASTTKYPSVKAIKEYVDVQNAAAGVADGTVTSSKIANATIVNADVSPTAAIDFTKLNIQKTDVLGLGLVKSDLGLANVDNTSDLVKPISTDTQTALNLKANTTDVTTSLALKANLSSPTFTGTVTSPSYASVPQVLIAGATISWDPANGLNANVTLVQNSTLNFTTNPVAGSYGTLVITQDATGGRTITLPSTANKVLGSTSTTTIGLSTVPNAKDILNFYYDGTNCYWNIGQGYGLASTASGTSNLSSGVSGTLAVANGGTGATTKTTAFDALSPMTTSGDLIYGSLNGTGERLSKGTDGQVLKLVSGLPSWQNQTGFDKEVEKVNFGSLTGLTNQANFTTAVGPYAGQQNQSVNATALGRNAGNSGQGSETVAVGNGAGATNQGNQAIAIGNGAGASGQGLKSIAIGESAGALNQHANSIVLNASGSALNTINSNALYISPIRNENSVGNILVYNTSTKEVTVASNSAGGRVSASGGSTYNDFVGFSFIGGDWAKNTGMFNDAPDDGSSPLKFRIKGQSMLEVSPTKVSALSTTASISKTTGSVTIAGGLGVVGDIYASNLNASGTLTAGTVTYPNTHGTANQVLTTTGSGSLTWTNTSTGDLKFVNLNNNIGIGTSTTLANASAGDNVAIGRNALGSYYTGGISGSMNIGIGTDSGDFNTTGARNIYVGASSGITNQTGSDNTFIGYNAATSVDRNIRNSISNSMAIGANAVVTASNLIQLGDTNITNVKTSGTLTAGTVTYPNTHNATTGQVLTTNGSGVASWVTPITTATAYSGTLPVSNGGTGLNTVPANGQIDIGNGTGFTRATLTAGTAITITNNAGSITIAAAVRPTTDQFTATAGQTSFTLIQIPLNAKIWMFINGVRTNNNAYSVSGTTVTYTPANNNNYAIVVNDRIEFDYVY